ncbi:MAG: protein-glutamate O-methyltransferase CheR [Bacteroidetes bacterium]|nr:protein-glutamate O-methyltransferase CheR [Bacteroidota bacterium]
MFEPIQDRIRVESAPKLSDETFIVLRDFIYSKTGIYFPVKKKYLLEGRLLKRLQVLKIGHFEDYVHLLKYSQQKENEFEYLCNMITINETFFFRNEAQIEAFQQKFADEVIKAKKAFNNRTLRIWSAACSSGEEPYTIAILYLEFLKPKYPDLNIEIIGTDINTAVLDMACKAEYNQYSIRSTPKLFLEKYFEQSGGVYKLKQEVKDLVRFEQVNLMDREKMRHMIHFDFIFCANVLIYFDEKAKIQVVGDLFNSLNRGGYLFIGFSEMLHRISTAFKLVSIPKTTAYKKE